MKQGTVDTAAVFRKASLEQLAEVYQWYRKRGTKTVTITGIGLEHDSHLNSIKQKLHDRIGTPHEPRRKMGKGTTEFQLGGLYADYGDGKLTVAQYLEAIARNIAHFSAAELETLQHVALQSTPQTTRSGV